MLILQVNIISSDKEAATLAPQAPSTSAKPTAHAWQAKSMLPMPSPPPTPQSATYYPIPTQVTTLLSCREISGMHIFRFTEGGLDFIFIYKKIVLNCDCIYHIYILSFSLYRFIIHKSVVHNKHRFILNIMQCMRGI